MHRVEASRDMTQGDRRSETCLFLPFTTEARASVIHARYSVDQSTYPTHQPTMNECLQQLRPQQAYRQEDGDGLNSNDVAGWGSHAGHGNLSRSGGIQSMNVPRVPDVRFLFLCSATDIDNIAISFSQHLYRFHVIQPSGQDQACSRNDDACVQVQRWYHCRRRLESNSWILCR